MKTLFIILAISIFSLSSVYSFDNNQVKKNKSLMEIIEESGNELGFRSFSEISREICQWQTTFFYSYFSKKPSFDLQDMIEKRAPAKIIPSFQES